MFTLQRCFMIILIVIWVEYGVRGRINEKHSEFLHNETIFAFNTGCIKAARVDILILSFCYKFWLKLTYTISLIKHHCTILS